MIDWRKRFCSNVCLRLLLIVLMVSSMILVYQQKNTSAAQQNNKSPGIRIHPCSNSPYTDISCQLETDPGVVYSISHFPLKGHVVLTVNQNRTAAFTLRIVSERQLLTVETSGSNSTRFEMTYHACYRGRHKAFLRILFDDPVDDLRENCMLAARNRIDRVEWMFMRGGDAPEDQICRSQWIWPAGHQKLISEQHFNHYRDQDSPHSRAYDISGFYQGLHYNYPFLSNKYLKQCLYNRRICLLGDSQSRYLTESLSGLVNPSLLETCHKSQNYCNLDPFVFYSVPYPHGLAANMTQGCTDVITNFGQWQSSWVEGRNGAWSSERYESEVRSYLERLSSLVTAAEKNITLYWLTCNAHPINKRLQGCPRDEHRFPFVLHGYNTQALRVARDFGESVRSINSTNVMFPLFDASFDSAHYRGNIGTVLARYVLTHICEPFSL